MSEPIFYIVELALPGVEPDAEFKTFFEWYAHVHTPHLYEAGFTTCTSYRAIDGDMEIVDIYQADDWSIFETDRFWNYKKVATADPHLPDFVGKSRNTRTPYHHVAWRGQSIEDMSRPLVADWVTVWRFAADEALLSQVAGWLAAEGEAALTAQGAAMVRLLRKTREAPTGTSIRPEGSIVIQWQRQPAPEAYGSGGLPGFLTAAIGDTPGFTGYRLYPWADDPDIRARFGAGRD